jgi:hypothetical protein
MGCHAAGGLESAKAAIQPPQVIETGATKCGAITTGRRKKSIKQPFDRQVGQVVAARLQVLAGYTK